jgi:hypothetical protein
MPSNCEDCPCHAEFGFCNLLIGTGDLGDNEYQYDANAGYIPEERDLRKHRRTTCPLREVTPPINGVLEALINEQQETIDKHFAELKRRYEKMQEVKNGFKGGSVPLCF